MAEDDPVTGHPHGGRNRPSDDDVLPGERPLSEEERLQGPPRDSDRADEAASRAATEGEMTSRDPEVARPTRGVPEQVDPPSPADATDGQPPGGSAANQQGRTPDQ